MESCLFCKIVAGKIPSKAVHDDADTYAFCDIHPAAPRHILVIPKKHITTLSESTDEDQAVLGHLLSTARKIAAKESLTDYRLVVNNGAGAGQTVFHLHLHLLAGRSLGWPPG